MNPPAASSTSTDQYPASRIRRWLALGDSYTIGESVTAPDRWTEQLVALLREHGCPLQLTAIARTGWTAAELLAAIDATRLEPPYDLVSLLIGVNNQYRGGSLDDYRHQFDRLLQLAIRFAGGNPARVLVLSIPDWSATPFAIGRDALRIAAEIDLFNAVNREAAGLAGAAYLDVTTESRRDGHSPGFVAADGLHPSGRMYAEWAGLALPAALRALNYP